MLYNFHCFYSIPIKNMLSCSSTSSFYSKSTPSCIEVISSYIPWNQVQCYYSAGVSVNLTSSNLFTYYKLAI